MGVNCNPKIVTNELKAYFDAQNTRSLNPAIYPDSIPNLVNLNPNARFQITNAPKSSGSLKYHTLQTASGYSTITSVDTGVTIAENGPITIEAVARISSIPALQPITLGAYIGEGLSFAMIIDGSEMKFDNGPGTLRTFSNPSTLLSSNWYHFVIACNGSQTTGFVNSISQGTSAFLTGPPAGSAFQSGGFTGNEFDIAMARLYNRALSTEEIRQNFNAIRGRYGI